MTHYIEKWECGHIASQCRCPGPKEYRTRPGKCPECAAPASPLPSMTFPNLYAVVEGDRVLDCHFASVEEDGRDVGLIRAKHSRELYHPKARIVECAVTVKYEVEP